VRFNSARLAAWLKRPAVRDRESLLLRGHKAFRAARKLTPTEANFPGILYVLLHSFAHIFIRELALESGYSAASVRERIYAAGHGEAPDVAGVLVYTAAPDSHGTLGGLVELGKPENLGRLIQQALERARICASDPLCAEHVPTHDRSLHGAACHACSFVAETSCEIGNRYLDRSILVPTLAGSELAFFGESST
jgi:MrfA Zn-binding domain